MSCMFKACWKRATPKHHVQDLGQVEPAGKDFQFMSDLHLEKDGYKNLHIPRIAPNLILAGDIGNIKDQDSYFAFLQHLCSQFERVLLVPGNHEYFHMERAQAEDVATHFADQLGDRFTWMDRQAVDVGDAIVLGCTLHSRIDRAARQQVRKEIPDFSYVGGWGIDEHNEAYERDRKWLKQQLANISKTRPGSRVIVATHFPPTWSMTSDSNYTQRPTGCFYGSKTLEDSQRWRGSGQVTHWIFGHTHWNATLLFGSTTVLSNQRFHGTSTHFDVERTI